MNAGYGWGEVRLSERCDERAVVVKQTPVAWADCVSALGTAISGGCQGGKNVPLSYQGSSTGAR